MRKFTGTGIGVALVGLSAVVALAAPTVTSGPQKIYADLISSPIKAVKHSLELTYGERDVGRSPAAGSSQTSEAQQIMLKPLEANDELRNRSPSPVKTRPRNQGSELDA